MNPGQSWPQMLGNEALVPFSEAEMLGNKALVTGAVLKAKTEITKKDFVFSEGHSKLQKKTFEKISSIFSVIFLDDAFTKWAVAGGNLCFFLGEEFGSVARNRATPRQNGFLSPKTANPFWRVARFRATEPNSSPKNNIDSPRRQPVS